MTEPASAALDARLDQQRDPARGRTRRLIAGLIGSLLTGDGAAATGGVDLVVTRRDTGREVLRTGAGTLEEADRLLATVRNDLETKSVAEFAREWRLLES
ncbi:hypothetical protein SOM11_07100 [Frigoribacterium sp. CFBP9039]|uniref:hypothetical protein n=1 Tax=Frigoribacterium sp. CFBP9029 TaxID=3096541 RepID=UPI002A6A7C93|nr:hypothetical protein [Frigoribacterium sp. CFBP9039]MDY0945753.1 hypothetical protein [Frigoribacterium sp. CFBP9039]